MKSADALRLFKEDVVGATIRAPDNYPEWDKLGYPRHRGELLRHWAEAKPRIVDDADRVAFIDAKLTEALESFDRGEREPGQSLMVQIYNALNQRIFSNSATAPAAPVGRVDDPDEVDQLDPIDSFRAYVVIATLMPPDEYPKEDRGGYAQHRSGLLRSWGQVKSGIVEDTRKAEVIDSMLAQALESFDRGQREPGRSLMTGIYSILNLTPPVR